MKHLFKALAAFQQEAPVIHKGTKGYGYSYADLPAIFEVINPLLKKHGLGFTQLINTNEEKHYLVTVLFHVETGEQLQSSTLIPEVELKGMNTYQAFGAGCSYFRRYCLSSICGLVTDVDTDAAGEQVKKAKPRITNERFNKAIEAVKNGSFDISELIDKFDLDDSQLSIINKI